MVQSSLKNIVLITASNPADPYNVCSVHLGPLALEAYLAEKGDFALSIIDDLDLLDRLDPHLVGISSVTENYGLAIEMARHIKTRFSIPIVVGGVHITSCPESLDPAFDAGICGEGEETFLEYLSAYPRSEDVPGIVSWREGKVHIPPRRRSLVDLDALPHARRKKWVETLGLPIVMTSRGCPYSCAFCSSPLMWGGCRTFSPSYVLEEVRELVEQFGATYIRFFDDVLTLDRKRLSLLVDMLCAEGLHQQVTFSCFTRSNLMDREKLQILAKGNIKFVAFGLESASAAVLETLKDRPGTLEESQKVIDMAFDEGIYVGCSVIIGAPRETEDDLMTTFAFLSNNEKKLFEVEINPLVPHPGTPIWDYALARGLVSTAMDWSLLKDYSYIPLFNPHRYIYLNEMMPYEKFLYYLRGFKSLHSKMIKMDLIRKYFGDMDMAARLRPPDRNG
jgi:anaerobic magnesium-protoporphyrin IX monomethyl ester cyclase